MKVKRANHSTLQDRPIKTQSFVILYVIRHIAIRISPIHGL